MILNTVPKMIIVYSLHRVTYLLAQRLAYRLAHRAHSTRCPRTALEAPRSTASIAARSVPRIDCCALTATHTAPGGRQLRVDVERCARAHPRHAVTTAVTSSHRQLISIVSGSNL